MKFISSTGFGCGQKFFKYRHIAKPQSLCAIMTNRQTIQVVDSWNMTTGVLVELKHELNGLETELVIKSETTGKEWRVKKRILFHHTADRQKKFPNEATAFTHLSFLSLEHMHTSAKNILDKEEQNIFQYQLQSLGPHFKTIIGDILLPLTIEKYACPCCGYKTFDSKPDGTYDICPVCFWEDDPVQLDDPDYEGGANPMSLRQAQHNFLEFGACDRDMLQNVRQHAKDEQRDENWQPLDRE